MPKRLFRTIAVALLVLAIPLQGLATVSAGQCMALEHHQDAGSHGDLGHAHDGADGHSHADGKKSDPHCGPCTACCASVSIAGSPTLTIAAPASPAQYFFSQSPPPGVQPDGHYRPPLAL